MKNAEIPEPRLIENPTEQPNTVPEAAVDELLEDPGLLQRISTVMRARGYAGSLIPPMLAYIALTSRLLDRPMNLAFVAASSAGKNRAIEAALELVPSEAVYRVSAASAKALIYSDEEYVHRIVFFSEADSIPDDGAGASAIRALITDNRMVYEVVEQVGGEYRTRRIVKAGPTGLITTSTRSLSYQLGTRVLEVNVADDPAQTREIMLAQARVAAGRKQVDVDVTPFLGVQQWLAKYGAHRVVIPFAERVAELLPAKHVRMRRDFPQLLAAIKTVAVLRQRMRAVVDGVVTASIDDYAVARDILAPVFDAVIAEGLTPVVRETVEAIHPDESNVSLIELAARLNISKSTASDRVAKAFKGDWLVNDDTRRGFPFRLRRGDPLPDAGTSLPSVQDVQRAFGCSTPASERSGM